jgi:hypothetical protein
MIQRWNRWRARRLAWSSCDVAQDRGRGEAGTDAAVDFEADVDLLVVVVPIEHRPHAALKQAVGFQQLLLAGLGRGQAGFRVRRPKIELRRVFQLRRAGRVGDLAVHHHVTDEPTVLGQETHHHAVLVWLRIHLNIRVPAGGKEAVDAGASRRPAQWLVPLQREDLVDFSRVEWLAGGFELDRGDPLALPSEASCPAAKSLARQGIARTMRETLANGRRTRNMIA